MWKEGSNFATTFPGNTSFAIVKTKDSLVSTVYNPEHFKYMFEQLITRLPFYCDMIVGGIDDHSNQSIENYFNNLKVKFSVFVSDKTTISYQDYVIYIELFREKKSGN